MIPTRHDQDPRNSGALLFPAQNMLVSSAKHSHQQRGLHERPGPPTRHGCVVRFSLLGWYWSFSYGPSWRIRNRWVPALGTQFHGYEWNNEVHRRS